MAGARLEIVFVTDYIGSRHSRHLYNYDLNPEKLKRHFTDSIADTLQL